MYIVWIFLFEVKRFCPLSPCALSPVLASLFWISLCFIASFQWTPCIQASYVPGDLPFHQLLLNQLTIFSEMFWRALQNLLAQFSCQKASRCCLSINRNVLAWESDVRGQAYDKKKQACIFSAGHLSQSNSSLFPAVPSQSMSFHCVCRPGTTLRLTDSSQSSLHQAGSGDQMQRKGNSGGMQRLCLRPYFLP